MQIARHILAQLDGQSLLRIAGVSRWWRVVSEDEHLWHALCTRLNIGRQIGFECGTHLQSPLGPVDSSASSDARFARVHAVCPSKAAYMRHQCTTIDWRSRQVVVRTHEAGT